MKVENNKFFTFLFFLIFVLCFSFMFLFFIHKEQRQVELLYDSGVETEGRIIKKICSNHGTIQYSYVIDDKKFTGTGRRCTRDVCESAKIDDAVTVTYLINLPEISRCGQLRVASGAVYSKYFIVFMFTAIALGYFFWLVFLRRS